MNDIRGNLRGHCVQPHRKLLKSVLYSICWMNACFYQYAFYTSFSNVTGIFIESGGSWQWSTEKTNQCFAVFWGINTSAIHISKTMAAAYKMLAMNWSQLDFSPKYNNAFEETFGSCYCACLITMNHPNKKQRKEAHLRAPFQQRVDSIS